MQPLLFELGGLGVYAYTLATVLGYGIGAAMGMALAVRDGRDVRDVIDGAIVIVISAVFGAKIFHTFFEAEGHQLPDNTLATGVVDLLRADPWHWMRVLEPGFVFYGGVVIGTLMGMFYSLRRFERSPFSVGDYCAPGLIFGGVIVGRIGCFLGGCCYGLPTDLPWAVHFPSSHETAGAAVHPVQLYDVAFGCVALVVMKMLYRRKRFGGEVFIITLASYAAWRFISELFRGDGDRGLWFGGALSTSQLVSLSIVPVLLSVWFFLYRRNPRGYRETCREEQSGIDGDMP